MTTKTFSQTNFPGGTGVPNEATNSWAWKQDTHSSSAKFVLVYLAFHTNNEGICDADIGAIARETGLSPKTISANLKRLCEDGLIRENGRRISESGRIVTYQLNLGGDFNGITKC